jgi:putative ABC transport system permease protein
VRRIKRPSEGQLDAEIAFHIEALTREKIAAGTSPADARREAMLEFGGREQVKEDLRDVRRLALLETVTANLRSGIRFVRKSPTFSITVILTLALGIGANSAVFSAIDAILLRALPFPDGDELVLLKQSERGAKNPSTFVAPSRLEDWNRMSSTFQAVSGWYTQDVSDFSGELPEKVAEALVAPRFLKVWGVGPAMGRDFTEMEQRFGGPRAVLVSDRYWRHRMHSDPNAAGKTIRLDAASYTVVGVMPASFLFPLRDVDIWWPSPPDAPYAKSRGSTWFTVLARMKPGIKVSQARADLSVVQRQLGQEFPKTDAKLAVDVEPLKENTIARVGRSLWILFVSVSLLLVIACTNIAALLLARTRERAREISVRFSLGASRGSLVVQLLTECFVLALAGASVGVFVAAVGVKGLRSLAGSIPRGDEIALDWRMVLYTLGCAVAATLLCGLFPAIRGTRREIAGELAHAGRSQVSTRNPLQWALVGIQVALAVTLLTGAGLLVRSLEELGRVSPGFETGGVMTFRISGNWGETTDQKKLKARVDRTLTELRGIRGVQGAATASVLPGIPSDSRTEITLTDAHSDEKIVADSRIVSTGYFGTMKIPLLSGEGCRESDPDFAAVVVNRSFNSAYPGGGVGRHLQLASSQFTPVNAEIRGIVADAREQGLTHEPGPTVYWCLSAPTPMPNFLVRAPMGMAETLRKRIHAIQPNRSVFAVSSLEEHLSDSFAENRLRTILLSLFALTAVALVCVGLYGTLSYFVTVRRREVGLRLALGASPGQVVRRFLGEATGVALAGCLVGLGLGLVGDRALADMLYGVSAADWPTFAGVAFGMMMVAGLSCLGPALRAARVVPMEVLRDE